MLFKLINATIPRFALAPAGEGAADGGAGGDDGAAAGGDDAGDEGGEGGEDPEKPEAGKEKPADKGEKGKAKVEEKAKPKADEKKPADAKPEKKTLLGKVKPAADDAGGKDAAKGKAGAADELDAWTPKLADGVKVDQEQLGELKTLAKANGWKSEQLQGVVELGVKMQERAGQAALAAHEKLVEGYEKDARADPEIGGAKLEATAEAAVSVIRRFAGEKADAVLEFLERTGGGSHPEVLRFFAKVNAATAEDDTTRRAGGKGGGGKDASDPMGRFTRSMYPKMAKELAKSRGETADD